MQYHTDSQQHTYSCLREAHAHIREQVAQTGTAVRLYNGALRYKGFYRRGTRNRRAEICTTPGEHERILADTGMSCIKSVCAKAKRLAHKIPTITKLLLFRRTGPSTCSKRRRAITISVAFTFHTCTRKEACANTHPYSF